MQYDAHLDALVIDILHDHSKAAGKILMSNKMKRLYEYVMSCTSFCDDQQTEHGMNMMTRMLLTVSHCTSLPRCKTCGKVLKRCNAKNIFLHKDIAFEDAFKKYCSPKCEMLDEDVMQKRKKTNLKTYGFECTLQNEEVMQKARQTMRMKYGVHYAQQNGDIHAKSDEARLKNLGYKHPLQNDGCKRKMKEHTSRRFFENNLMKNEVVQPLFELSEYMEFGKDSEHLYHWKCMQCGNEFDAKLWTSWFKQSGVRSYARCCCCYPEESGKSAEETDFFNAVKSLTSYEVIANARVLKDDSSDKRTFNEIDVYIPQLKLGFEYDGIWWHSIDMKPVGNANECHYHLQKTQLAERAGIKLMHVRSDIWKNNRDATTEMIRSMIAGNVDFSSMISQSGILIVDRSIWCKCWFNDSFTLLEETPPNIIKCKSGNSIFYYEDGGTLVFNEILNDESHITNEKS